MSFVKEHVVTSCEQDLALFLVDTIGILLCDQCLIILRSFTKKITLRTQNQSRMNSDKIFTFKAASVSCEDVLFQQSESQTSTPQEQQQPASFGNNDIIELKSKLDTTRSKIDNINQRGWSSHTQSMNKFAKCSKFIREFREGELVSNIWIKFYEVLKKFEPEIVHSKTVHSVHINELTGSVVSALNHYMKTNFENSILEWHAVHNSTPLSGNGTYDTFKQYTIQNWITGNDGTGDLNTADNITSICQQIKSVGAPISLVTADGHASSEENYLNEEINNIPMIYGEIVTAIHLLHEGGSLIIKFFTLFENYTVSLLYSLRCWFTDVHIFKPNTSKSTSSEVYVVCLGYIPVSQNVLQTLLKHVDDKVSHNDSIIPLDKIDKGFLEEIAEATKLFSNDQIQSIEELLESYNKRTSKDTRENMLRLQSQIAEDLTKQLGIKKLNRVDRLCTNEYITGAYQVRLDNDLNEIKPTSKRGRSNNSSYNNNSSRSNNYGSNSSSSYSGKRSRNFDADTKIFTVRYDDDDEEEQKENDDQFENEQKRVRK
jgi:cap2 methyltransferase